MKYILMILFLVSCSDGEILSKDPEFKVGDCVTQHIKYGTETEFKENEIREYDEFFKVTKVGKKNYLAKSFTTNYPTIIIEMEYGFWYFSQFKKTECPEGF